MNKVPRFAVTEDGYFGEFGGQFVPEMLFPNVEELAARYLEIVEGEVFQKEYLGLLKNYVGRPTALYPAAGISKELGARIFLKREDLAHTGSHKINNAIGQVLLAKQLGRKRIIAETGAGQHGVATATACALLGFPCRVYMGEVDVQRQEPNVKRMQMLGTEVFPVKSGSRTLKDAVNEALRDWIANPQDTHYVIGSVVGPHPFPDLVARLQAVIGREVKAQLAAQGIAAPHAVIACVGGGSNAIGIFREFLSDETVRLIGVEAAGEGLQSKRSAATLALGKAGVLHGSKTVLMQTDDGQVCEAHSISAGLDYPGIGPEHAMLHASKRVLYESATDSEALDAAFWLARREGIIPALESAHAFAVLRRINWKKDDCVVVNLSGRGDKDMAAYCARLEQRHEQ